MEAQGWIQLSKAELEILEEALAAKLKKSRGAGTSGLAELKRKLRRRSVPKITVGVKGGMVYWVTGNPFAIRICDYDIDGVYPEGEDELGRPCVISFAPEDESARRNRYTVCR